MDFSNTHFSLRRGLTSYSKVRSAMGPICRAWPIRKHPSDGAYLNVGCGPFPTPGFFNIDYDYHEGVDLYWDLRKPLPINDNCVGGIFTEHCLEHLERDDAEGALRDFHRIMKTGAVLRISIPDAEIYFRRYVAGETLPYAEDLVKNADYSPVDTVNRLFRESGHRFIYDCAAIAHSLKKAGFSTVERAEFGVGRDSRLLVDQKERAVESLYVEAVKD